MRGRSECAKATVAAQSRTPLAGLRLVMDCANGAASDICGIERGPGQMIRIADFDDLRRQLDQCSAPLRRSQRHAIPGTERDARAAQRENSGLDFLGPCTRHDQAVTHVAVPRIVAMLGQQVTLYAAAIRGKKQGDVGNMHSR